MHGVGGTLRGLAALCIGENSEMLKKGRKIACRLSGNLLRFRSQKPSPDRLRQLYPFRHAANVYRSCFVQSSLHLHERLADLVSCEKIEESFRRVFDSFGIGFPSSNAGT